MGDDTRPASVLRRSEGSVGVPRSNLRVSSPPLALRGCEEYATAEVGTGPFVGVDARCEGCGLGFVFEDLRLLAVAVEAEVLECGDCGCPVYLVPDVDELGAA